MYEKPVSTLSQMEAIIGNGLGVIVDPYSSGQLIAPEFQRHGVSCLAVHAKPLTHNVLGRSFVRSDFVGEHFFGDDLQELARVLSAHRPICVIAGAESGVELADNLSEILELPHNDLASSQARRNKFDMHERLLQRGIAHIAHAKITSVSEAQETYEAFGGGAVVVKPLASAGSDNVRLCCTASEVSSAVLAILESKTVFGGDNDGVLIQRYLQGVEYVVDAVSCDGRHFTTNLCRYTKDIVDGIFLYRETRYLEPTGELAGRLIAYNDRVLDALGITQGASHSEIILTVDGPVLVEVGARLHGGKTSPLVVAKCAAQAPVASLVQSIIDAPGFLRRVDIPNKFHSNAVAFTFAVASGGVLNAAPGIDVLKGLPSFFALNLSACIGQFMSKTRDLQSSPGWVVLENPSEHALERDLECVKSLEAEGLFEFSWRV